MFLLKCNWRMSLQNLWLLLSLPLLFTILASCCRHRLLGDVSKHNQLNHSFARPLLTMNSSNINTKTTFDELEKELSNIVGLKHLKTQLRTWAKGLVMDEKRRQLGIKVDAKKPPHMAFLGNPGVGKTSMARMLGKFLNNFRILPNNRVVEVQRADLVAQYTGQTGPKTKAKINEAEGGILFVDEAYQLMVPGSRNDFGKEALEEIMHAMGSGKLSIIFAGYVEPMKLVFDSNEGFRRRVTTQFVFEDFSCEELAQILHLKIPNEGFMGNVTNGLYQGCKLSLSCSISAIAQLIERETSNEQRAKMNGGLIDQLLTKAKENLDGRLDVDCVDIAELTTITFEDLEASLALLKPNPNLMASKYGTEGEAPWERLLYRLQLLVL